MAASQLPADDSLQKLQTYIWKINQERGFSTEKPSEKLVMLMEEVGELAKAVRKQSGLKFTNTTRQTEAAEELADVLIVLLGLSSLLNIDIFQALLDKEAKNRKRTWR